MVGYLVLRKSQNFTQESTKEDVGVCIFLLENRIIFSSSKNEKQETFVVSSVRKVLTGVGVYIVHMLIVL